MSAWSLVYDGYDPAQEGLREALCTLGNGYFATRGAAPEASADGVHYPGTYVAGGFDRLTTPVAGREVENEDLVNLPNWLPFAVRADGGHWLDLAAVEVLAYRQELDLRRGILTRRLRFADGGRTTTVSQRRLVSMAEPHLAAIESTLTAEDWSGVVHIRSGLDGRITNSGVARYRQLRGDHLTLLGTGAIDLDAVWLEAEMKGRPLRIALAGRTRVAGQKPAPGRLLDKPGWIGHELSLELTAGVPVRVEKAVALYTSRDPGGYAPLVEAQSWIRRAADFEALLERHVRAWERAVGSL